CSTLYSTMVEQAVKLLNEGKYDDAIKLLETNGEQNDILLAIAYLGKKEFQTAKVFALQYWLQNEDNVLANFILGFISEELKDYQSALFYWNGVYKNAKDLNLKRLAKRHIDVLKKISEGK
ncbi:MAG: hypothetical protein NZ839_04295, partial [Endomicrobia bacterium]|nr:hypothetical protein [Endomicrobiia bacterium]